MRRNENGGKIIILFAAVIIGGAAYYFFGGGGTKQPSAVGAPTSVSVVQVLPQDMPNTINLVGTVFAYETVSIKSRLDSQITSVHFKDGDEVAEGVLLFKLDDSVLKAQLNQYQANLKRDEAQLENARTQYVRYEKLSKQGFASSEKLEEARAAFKTQEAAVNATHASIDSVKSQLAFTAIKAPISGRAGTINVTRGNNVKANDVTPLVTINQVKPIRIQFAIPQKYYDALRSVSKDAVEIEAKRSDAKAVSVGKLEYIDNNIDTATGSFLAKAVFENADEKLWPGMFANVSIVLSVDKNALVIPQVAVQSGQDGTFVYAVDVEGKKAVKRPIEVLRMQDNQAIIKSGLAAGDKVIVDGLLRVSDGAAIEIFSPADAQKENVEKAGAK